MSLYGLFHQLFLCRFHASILLTYVFYMIPMQLLFLLLLLLVPAKMHVPEFYYHGHRADRLVYVTCAYYLLLDYDAYFLHCLRI